MGKTLAKPLKIYNASAGSGKTYTLVQEYLRIILQDLYPGKFKSILAMTFTNKAANEMKTRIIQALEKLAKPVAIKSDDETKFLLDTAKEQNISPELLEERASVILNEILHHYGAFSIMTLDKFTHKIIRTFARDLNLSMDFDVELDVESLRKNITDLLIDQVGRDNDLTELMLRYANSNLLQDKSWDFSGQVFDFSDLLFKESALKAISLLSKLSPSDFLNLQSDLQKEIAILQNTMEGSAIEACELIRSKGLTLQDFKGKSTNSVYAYFIKVKSGNYVLPSDTLAKYVAANEWAEPKSHAKNEIINLAPLLKKYLDQVCNGIEKSKEKFTLSQEILKNINNLSLLNHLMKLAEELKAEQNILLISDFYKKIAEVIMDEKVPFLYERMGVRYEHFLLDEFQDTSRLQWINMVPLIHNSLAAGNTNLIVGDGKQAIYRWRNGEVEQFTMLPNKIFNPENIASLHDAEELFQSSGEIKNLDKNYRSAPEIVHFNNTLFNILAKNLSPGLVSIYETVKQIPVKKHAGFVEVFLKDKLTIDEQFGYIHENINRCLNAGWRWKDICVLVRRNDQGADVAAFLTNLGMKVISPDSLFISKDQQVKFIFNLMCSAAMPYDRNYKIKTLEHYATLFTGQQPGIIMDKYRSLINSQDIESIFRQESYSIEKYTSFENLFDYALHLVHSFNLDEEKNPYIQFFLEEIHEFEKRHNTGIRDFAEWFTEKGKSKSIVSPEGANAIQVMTIHRAKGLEFPVVICPFFDWSPKLENQVSWIEDESSTLPAFFLKMNSSVKETKYKTVYESESAKLDFDNLNLIYVALTRPECALFISGDSSKSRSIAKDWLKTALNELQWALSENDRLSTGELKKTDEHKKKTANAYSITEKYETLDKLKFSFKSAENWSVEQLDEKRKFGSELHLILSRLNNEEEQQNTIDYLLKKGMISSENKKSLEAAVKDLFRDERFKSYFVPEAVNEKAMVNEKGQKLIPDKLIFYQHEVVVVDFKTGLEKDQYLGQVRDYVQTIQRMGYPNVRGEIYYVHDKTVIEVR